MLIKKKKEEKLCKRLFKCEKTEFFSQITEDNLKGKKLEEQS